MPRSSIGAEYPRYALVAHGASVACWLSRRSLCWPAAATMLHLSRAPHDPVSLPSTPTTCSGKPELSHGDNTPQPVRTLRDWLDRLAPSNRLAVIKPNADLKFEARGLCQAARRHARDAVSASRWPRDAGGIRLVSDRAWIAEAMARRAARHAARASRMRRSIRCRGKKSISAPAQEVVHRRQVDLRRNFAAADAQRA